MKNPADFGRVGLVIGGDSAEREVSLDGGKAVGAALERSGIAHEALVLAVDQLGQVNLDRAAQVTAQPHFGKFLVKANSGCPGPQ